MSETHASETHGSKSRQANGVGLGLRWPFLEAVLATLPSGVDFWELAPENYMRRGGYYPAALEQLREHYPVISHGLSLSLGDAAKPDASLLRELRAEIKRLGAPWHSDHVSFSTCGPWVLHELLPLQFSQKNVQRVADNIRSAEDALACPLLVENISWYCHPGAREMPESEFLTRILEMADCRLLLDVNNVYVNSQNHDFDAREFLQALPLERVAEIHVAGHTRAADQRLIDNHGTEVSEPVYELLQFVLARTGAVPVLLERDNAIPDLADLLVELERVRAVYDAAAASATLGVNH